MMCNRGKADKHTNLLSFNSFLKCCRSDRGSSDSLMISTCPLTKYSFLSEPQSYILQLLKSYHNLRASFNNHQQFSPCIQLLRITSDQNLSLHQCNLLTCIDLLTTRSFLRSDSRQWLQIPNIISYGACILRPFSEYSRPQTNGKVCNLA